jgi:hypothetical protein
MMQFARHGVVLIGAAIVLAACASGSSSSNSAWAYDDCSSLRRGERSFCMIQAHEAEQLQSAQAQKNDVTIHSDNDPTNDTPAQVQAKRAYQAAAEQCADVPRGQQSFCMEQAAETYNKAMGW